MEYAKNEITVVEKTVAEVSELNIRELADLQLALVGGGGGEVIFF
ncbi:MAG: hypothetical protein ABIQ72_05730 [Usitatibacter sp.]